MSGLWVADFTRANFLAPLLLELVHHPPHHPPAAVAVDFHLRRVDGLHGDDDLIPVAEPAEPEAVKFRPLRQRLRPRRAEESPHRRPGVRPGDPDRGDGPGP